MKFYLIAGEASGDLHASNLVKTMKSRMPHAEFRCWGGELLQKEVGEVVVHYNETAFMGLLPVLLNLSKLKALYSFCKKDIEEYNPDGLILIDYPGFNLKIAEFAKKRGYKVFYYIAPKVWASRTYRVKKIREYVDKLYCILPFEKSFFEKHKVSQSMYVGNPVKDVLRSHTYNSLDIPKDNTIALLPGSRKNEIKSLLPIFISAVEKDFLSYSIVIAGAPGIAPEFYETILKKRKFDDRKYSIIYKRSYDVLKNASVAIVSSGTATLETALLKVPQVIGYKLAGGALCYFLIKKLILHVKYVSLVNLILDKKVIKELLQHHCTATNIKKEVTKLINDKVYRQNIHDEYNKLEQLLGDENVSENVANSILQELT